LLIATLLVVGTTLVFPFTPIGELFGFGPLPAMFFLLMGMIVVFYILAAEVMKRLFYRWAKF